jgi:hypothetical protein
MKPGGGNTNRMKQSALPDSYTHELRSALKMKMLMTRLMMLGETARKLCFVFAPLTETGGSHMRFRN